MNQRRFIVVAVVATAGLAVIAWRAARAGRGAEAERQALAGRRTELMARLQRDEADLAAANKTEAAPVAATEDGGPEKAVPASESPAEVSLVDQLKDPK